MLGKFRARLTYANVVASLALFLVLAGGSAVALTGTNTVFSDDIVDGEVKYADIGVQAVSSTRIWDQSIQSIDVKDNALTGTDITESTLGTVPRSSNGVYRIRRTLGIDQAVAPVTLDGIQLSFSCTKDAELDFTFDTVEVKNTTGASLTAQRWNYSTRNDDEAEDPHHSMDGLTIAPNASASLFPGSIPPVGMGGTFQRMIGGLIADSGDRTISISYNAVADGRGGATPCFTTGTATVAKT